MPLIANSGAVSLKLRPSGLICPRFLFWLFCLLKHLYRSLTNFCSTASKLGSALEGKLLQTIKLINGQSLLFWSLFSFSPFNNCPSHGCIFFLLEFDFILRVEIESNWYLILDNASEIRKLTNTKRTLRVHMKNKNTHAKKAPKSSGVPKSIVSNPAVVNPSKVKLRMDNSPCIFLHSTLFSVCPGKRHLPVW